MFGLSRIQLGISAVLVVLLLASAGAAAHLLKKTGRLEQDRAQLTENLAAEKRNVDTLAGELAERDALDRQRAADRATLAAQNVALNRKLTEEAQHEPDPTLRECAGTAPPVGVRRLLLEHAAHQDRYSLRDAPSG